MENVGVDPIFIWKIVCVLVPQLCPTLCNPMDCKPTRLLCPWNFPGKNTELPFLSPGALPIPWIEPESPALQADSLPSEPPGNPICKTDQELHGTRKANGQNRYV